MRFSILIIFFFLLKIGTAQTIDFETFRQSIDVFGIESAEPTEARAKFFQPKEKSYLKENFRIKMKKEDLEIWVAFRPVDSADISTQMPNIFCRTVAVNAAINDEEAVTTVLRLSEEYLKETFGADWGREMYFQPKKSISDRAHCKLISLYKNEIGHFNVFYFFDEKSKNLDTFSEMFRFKAESF